MENVKSQLKQIKVNYTVAPSNTLESIKKEMQYGERVVPNFDKIGFLELKSSALKIQLGLLKSYCL